MFKKTVLPALKVQERRIRYKNELSIAAQCVRAGGIIAYPTEAVFGLGCDPQDEDAVQRLLHIKRRLPSKGLILVASRFNQLLPYCETLPEDRLEIVRSSWPGPYTWLIPAKKTCPVLLTGSHTSIAVRVSAHPAVRALCQLCGHALVSTSANRSHDKPALSSAEVFVEFGNDVNYIVSGTIRGKKKPTTIRDAMSGKLIRA